jgi:predicted glycogen debranching enzyme
MISLAGLTTSTGRANIAKSILMTFAQYVDRGMLPNNFPEIGETPGYNTVDATLWYFEAIRSYYRTTGDNLLVLELFPVLQEIIDWHIRGTRYNIHLDPQDGLIYAGEEGVQLTWMDAKIDNWVVTPRIGKPVEINALWYNALRIMEEFADLLGMSSDHYRESAEQTKSGFNRFWNYKSGYCYDVLDGPAGDDPSLRPNQIISASLFYSPLDTFQIRAVVDVCSRHLLTPYGLRSLSPVQDPGHPNPNYIGRYGGNRRKRDTAYHQGTVWAWLLGPFICAHLRAYRDPVQAKKFMKPIIEQLTTHGIGSISEIFDGNTPFSPRGCIAQAWSVAEILRVWTEINQYKD